MRSEFEKLPEIKNMLERSGGGYYRELTNDYHHCNIYIDKYINGAWYAYQEQQKIIDELIKEKQDHIDRMNKLFKIKPLN